METHPMKFLFGRQHSLFLASSCCFLETDDFALEEMQALLGVATREAEWQSDGQWSMKMEDEDWNQMLKRVGG